MGVVALDNLGATSGAMRINGVGHVFITPDDQAGADPLVAFRRLVLTAIPEPSTALLSAIGLAGLFAMIHRRRGARRDRDGAVQ
jgi:PEP-CTERM motif